MTKTELIQKWNDTFERKMDEGSDSWSEFTILLAERRKATGIGYRAETRNLISPSASMKKADVEALVGLMDEVIIELEGETYENVIDVNGVNFNNIEDIKKVVNVEAMPEKVQNFIAGCNSFALVSNTLLLYKDRKIVAEGTFFVDCYKAQLDTLGAGDVFQWNIHSGITAEEQDVQEMGFIVQQKRTSAHVDKMKAYIRDMEGQGKEVQQLILDTIKSAEALVGVWTVHTAKLKESLARDFYEQALVSKVATGSEFRLIKGLITYNKRTGMIATKNPEVFEILEE